MMPRGKKFTAEQIIGKLREAEVGLAQGKTLSESGRMPTSLIPLVRRRPEAADLDHGRFAG
jgi:hypothetical protein